MKLPDSIRDQFKTPLGILLPIGEDNKENIQKYADDHVDTRPETNRVFDASYDELAEQLFPNRSQP